MQTARRESQDDIAGVHGIGIDQRFLLDNADDGTGKIKSAWQVDIWHLRRFASKQSAANFPTSVCYAAYNSGCLHRVEPAHCQVVHKEEGLCALRQQVID